MMKQRVEKIINSLNNLELWSIWEDIPMYLGIAELYDQGKMLSTRQVKRLNQILSMEESNDK